MVRKIMDVCVVACVAAWLGLSASAAEVSANPMKLLPEEAADAFIVGSVDLDQLARSGGLDSVLKVIFAYDEQQTLRTFIQDAKIDALKDVHAAAIAYAPMARRQKMGLVIAILGSFDGDAVLKAAAKLTTELTPFTYAEYSLLGLPARNRTGGQREMIVGVLDGKVLLIGTETWATKAIDLHKGTGKCIPETAQAMVDLSKLADRPIKASFNPAMINEEAWTDEPFRGKGLEGTTVTAATVTGDIKQMVLTLEGSATVEPAESVAPIKAVLEQALVPGFLSAQFAVVPMPKVSAEGNTIRLSTSISLNKMLDDLNPLRKARADARELKCKNNLKIIGVAVGQYLDGPGKKANLPRKLKDLVDSGVIVERLTFVCPEDDYNKGADWQCSYGSIFDLTDKPLTGRYPSDALLAWDDKPRHSGRRNVMYFDCHAETVTEGAFQQLLTNARKAIAEQQEAK